ncbi:conserved membrane hypothetical protein [Hyella patelloides LEGE 07179]|uniref:Ferric reductase n=1 Tax=Hyella patelloides LEGE 07179 TaxID=945734 RepID=A0A563VTM4_9CYAN|nr:sulfite exporter TauE/SafE family protein [Hyella patelloides]VEP14748.1 conserved membrane hypothetical protein [Hyella patelloides LEGE 07179]
MSIAIDLLLISTLGLFGSFGHCAGMCGPLAVSFTLSGQSQKNWLASFSFHLLLNLGRVISYGLVGIALGSVGSLIFTAKLRQVMGILTGLLLIWLGLSRIAPKILPKLPIFHPLQGQLHQKLSMAMSKVANTKSWWTPLILGLFWGLIPCGFLYIAQIKAAETGSIIMAVLTMLAFGLGTMPTMVGVGVSASRLSADRKSQLFNLGGWITLVIGLLTLIRTQAMIDYTGHGALLLLMLALIARPISKWWSTPLQYRRLIGVGSYVLAIAHTLHMLDHSLNWNLQAVSFMIPNHQRGLLLGVVALLLMTPAAVTSNDYLQQKLGKYWRKVHLLSVPALVLVAIHSIFLGSHYLGELNFTWHHQLRAIALTLVTTIVLGLRIVFSSSSKKIVN